LTQAFGLISFCTKQRNSGAAVTAQKTDLTYLAPIRKSAETYGGIGPFTYQTTRKIIYQQKTT